MAFRLVSQRLMTQGANAGRRASSASFFRTLSAASSTAITPSRTESELPSARDVMIQLTFVDPSGARRKVPGIIGKTLYEISELHGIELGPASFGADADAIRSDTWTEPLYGEGPCSGFDHVLLVGNGVETAKPRDHIETRMLNHYWDEDEIFPESRLATQITLTKEMDGMTVYVPDRICDDIP